MIKIDFEINSDKNVPKYSIASFGYRFTKDKNGKYHSYNDFPAIIYEDGTKEWYKHGKRHRENGLPAVILSNGYRKWYKKGKRIED